jgi:UPF0271 protein
MTHIDLNADLGEGITLDGQSVDTLIMPYIHSANIACGYHAGDDCTMRTAITLCMSRGIRVGAHPGYADKPNFGRLELGLTPAEIFAQTLPQLDTFHHQCKALGATLHHIKPHGALYHRLIDDEAAADAFLDGVEAALGLGNMPSGLAVATDTADPAHGGIAIVGFPGSALLRLAASRGMRVLREAFVDRGYAPDGRLLARSEPGAVLDSADAALAQLQRLRAANLADTFCVHGDSPRALDLARAIYAHLNSLSDEN